MTTHKHTEKHTPHAFAHVACPCGQTVHVPVAKSGAGYNYEIMAAKCDACGRIAAGGNAKTGQINNWMTPEQVNRANDEYAAQLYSADMNEFYGCGEW